MPEGIRHDGPQGATFVELFFDLVFVFAITQLTASLAHDLTPTGFLNVAVVFWLVWWAWTQFTWTLNEADTEHTSVRLLTLIATAIAFFMALTVPLVAEQFGWIFSCSYLAVRGLGLALQVRLAGDEIERRTVRLWLATSSLGLVAVAVSIFVVPEDRIRVLAIAAILDVIAALRAGQGEWRLFSSHFAERHGLFVIIALGESLIVAGATISEVGLSVDTIVVTAAAVAIACALWWTYYHRAEGALETAMAASPVSSLGTFARDVYSFGHLPVIGGVVVFAAGLELALGHPDESVGTAGLAMASGIALFLGGVGLALVRAGTRATSWRWVGALVLLASVPVVDGLLPVLAVPIMAALVVVVAVGDHFAGAVPRD